MPTKHNESLQDVQAQMRQLDGGRYQLLRKIGSGSYGIVLEALDTTTGGKVAIKRVSPEIFRSPLLAGRILREIKLLGHFDHENIVGLKDILMPPSADFDCLYIAMDIMESDLKAIIKSGQALTEKHIQYFIYQLLRGLDCIHKAEVIHRDITPSNLLVNTNCDLKICDFGLAHEDGGNSRDMTDYVVMRWYRAPELVMEHKHYTTAVDMWGCGCIMGEMLRPHRGPIFPGKDRIDQLDVIMALVGTPTDEEIADIGSAAARKYIKRRPPRTMVDFTTYFIKPEGGPLGSDCLDLLRRMLQFSPHRRISVADALNHPYFAEMHDPAEVKWNPGQFRCEGGDSKDLTLIRQLIFKEIQAVQQRNADKNRRLTQSSSMGSMGEKDAILNRPLQPSGTGGARTAYMVTDEPHPEVDGEWSEGD